MARNCSSDCSSALQHAIPISSVASNLNHATVARRPKPGALRARARGRIGLPHGYHMARLVAAPAYLKPERVKNSILTPVGE